MLVKLRPDRGNKTGHERKIPRDTEKEREREREGSLLEHYTRKDKRKVYYT